MGWLVGTLFVVASLALIVAIGVLIAFFFESHENRELRLGHHPLPPDEPDEEPRRPIPSNEKGGFQMSNIERWPDFIRSLPEVELPFPGARGWMIQGTDQQVVFIEFDDDVEVPEHAHAEQLELAVAGGVVLRSAGKSTHYAAGDSFFIPAGVPHAATVHAGYKAMIVFNARDRYKPRAASSG
jgi:hypothetical protein